MSYRLAKSRLRAIACLSNTNDKPEINFNPSVHSEAPYFIILYCLTPDDFTQGKGLLLNGLIEQETLTPGTVVKIQLVTTFSLFLYY